MMHAGRQCSPGPLVPPPVHARPNWPVCHAAPTCCCHCLPASCCVPQAVAAPTPGQTACQLVQHLPPAKTTPAAHREDGLLRPVLGNEVCCAACDCEHHNQGGMQLGGCTDCCCGESLSLQTRRAIANNTVAKSVRGKVCQVVCQGGARIMMLTSLLTSIQSPARQRPPQPPATNKPTNQPGPSTTHTHTPC